MRTDYLINYDHRPHVSVPGDHRCFRGYEAVAAALSSCLTAQRQVLTIDCYPGVLTESLRNELGRRLNALVIEPEQALLDASQIEELIRPFNGGDDPLFGLMNNLTLPDFFNSDRLHKLREEVRRARGRVLVCGVGASLVAPEGVVVLADMPRWELQQRQRQNLIGNLGLNNLTHSPAAKYKTAYFIEWRVADRHKKPLLKTCDFLLDTTNPKDPRMISGAALRAGLCATARRPFRVVPFFDPAPWGGQWMRETFGLPEGPPNYGWCFDGVPEENSLLLRVDGVDIEIPAINVVFQQPVALLGDSVHARFGTEFPIRFDLLDTIRGGHLSFQVHPLTEYIQQHFGIPYTQDESYYLLDAEPDATVYLGLKPGVDPEKMRADLEAAQRGERLFPADLYANRWPARRHDHFLIPAGTVHCSGKGSMVLEISATPYIFTFKMWDWGRLGLDGKPRPINIHHALANIQWNRDTNWTRRELINVIESLDQGEGWRSERTGLHRREFIDTVRHWFTKLAPHTRTDSVDVLNLVQGSQAWVESPDRAFEPFLVHFAETFILPAAAGPYTLRPEENAKTDAPCATIRARVRCGC